MSYALHVGMRKDRAEVPRQQFAYHGLGRALAPLRDLGLEAVHVDGDGWNCWAEAPGTDVNDEDTLHVVFQFDAKPELIRDWALPLIRESYELEPMGGYPQQRHVEAVITDADAWHALNGEDGVQWDFLAPCEWCDRYVMDEEADPNLKTVCLDCAEKEGEDEEYTEQAGDWAYHVEAYGSESATNEFWRLVREAEKQTGVRYIVRDAVPIDRSFLTGPEREYVDAAR